MNNDDTLVTDTDEDTKLDGILAKADELAAELVEQQQFQSGPVLPTELTPEMLENMDPAQLQQLMKQMVSAQRRKGKRATAQQSFYTRKQIPRATRVAKRRASKKARAATARFNKSA